MNNYMPRLERNPDLSTGSEELPDAAARRFRTPRAKTQSRGGQAAETSLHSNNRRHVLCSYYFWSMSMVALLNGKV